MNDWGLLSANPTILDIGCGTGHYAHITGGEYLGIDLNERYIDYAVKKNGSSTRRFQVMNVTDLYEQDKKFDIVLMVDILHHITDGQCERLLTTVSKIATRHIVSFEPVADQTNALGRQLIKSDRGKNMRSVKELHQLFHQTDLDILKENGLQHGMVYKTVGFLCTPRYKRAEIRVIQRLNHDEKG